MIDFPLNLLYLDGSAYFAGPHDRSIAQEYNQSYGEGILEVIIDSVSYIEYFKPLEFRYDEQNGIVGLSPIIHECEESLLLFSGKQ